MADALDPVGPNSSIGPLLLSLQWSLAGVSVVILALRLYTAACIVRRIALEDYLMLIAVICALVQTSLLTVSIHWGLGRHAQSLSREHVVNAMKFVVLCQGWGITSAAAGRISFSVYLLRFVMLQRIRRILLYFFIWSQVLVNALTIVLIYVQCGSYLEALWDGSIDASCWSPLVQRDFSFFQCSWNSLTDLFLTVLPATFVWNLPLSWTKKLGVSVLLGVSILAFVESVIKGYMIKVLGEGDDLTWHIATFHLWAVSENYIIIVAASIPTLCPLVRRARRSHPCSYEMYGSE